MYVSRTIDNKTNVLLMYCKCAENVLQMYFKCTANVLKMYCKCAENVLQIYFKCTANVLTCDVNIELMFDTSMLVRDHRPRE